MGGTTVTVSGGGIALSETTETSSYLGFIDGVENDTVEGTVPAPLAALDDIVSTALTDSIELEWSGITDRTLVYDRIDIDFGSTPAFVLESSVGSTEVIPTGAELQAIDGTGSIPLPFSTFAAAHGQSFSTADGFKFTFDGVPPGNGGLQIHFSDDGAGGTKVTLVTPVGVSPRSDDDSMTGAAALGFFDMNEADTLDPTVPPELAALADIDPVVLSDPIQIGWFGVGVFVFDGFDIDGDSGATPGIFFTTSSGSPNMPMDGAGLEGQDDEMGIIPLPYSTFAAAHGMSFPTTDGFTFVFEGSPASDAVDTALAACDKSQLKRKIKKLKKKLKKVKRSGNTTKAKKLKKKLKKLKKKLKSLC